MYNGWWSIKENIHGNVVFLNISKDLKDLFFSGISTKTFYEAYDEIENKIHTAMPLRNDTLSKSRTF